jgi:hypothetical protein
MSTASVESEWWSATLAAVLEQAQRPPRSPSTAWLRIADGVLEVVSDHQPLLDELETIYGDLGMSPPPSPSGHLRCTATRVPGLPLLSVRFDTGHLPDLIGAARGPHRFRSHPGYVETPGPLPGWRALVRAEAGDRLFLTANGRQALVNLDEAPPESVVDWIVCVAQSVQAGMLFLHAGTVGVGGAAALLIAPTGGGKSTTALAVAQRGHAFLGDDVAAVRLATREVLPFPRSAGLRAGPLARALEPRVRACRHVRATNRFGVERTLVRVSDLFPGSVSGPLPLRFAFVLDGVTDRAAIADFRPGLGERRRLQCVVTDTSAAWGHSPGRDLVQFLSVVNLLSGLRCHLVRRGSPDETAGLIEAVMMEGAWT